MSESAAPSPSEPKKSKRLAEKRKLREEGGGCGSSQDDDFYFTPYFNPLAAAKRMSTSPITVLSESPTASGKNKTNHFEKRSSSPLTRISPSTSTSTAISSPSTTAVTVKRKLEPDPFSQSQEYKSVPDLMEILDSPINISTNSGKRGSPTLNANVFEFKESTGRLSPFRSSKNHEKQGSKISPPSTSTSNSISSSSTNKKLFSNTNTNTSSSTATAAGTSSTSLFSKDDLEEDEEMRWLDALETGEHLEDDVLRKIQDPKLMTSRQRSLQEKKTFAEVKDFGYNDLDAPSLSSAQETQVTQEMIKLRADKIEKRRIQAQEKKRKDQKNTIDRLLKKSRTKFIKPSLRARARIPKTINEKADADESKLVYTIRYELNTITFPPEMELPPILQQSSQPPPTPPPFIKCSVQDCQNRKKYNCSQTNVPLCSLECFKKNLASRLSPVPPELPEQIQSYESELKSEIEA